MTNFVKNMNHIPVQENIYTSNGGRSFRVRMTIDGKRFSKNFKNKQKAQSFRKQLLALREIAQAMYFQLIDLSVAGVEIYPGFFLVHLLNLNIWYLD